MNSLSESFFYLDLSIADQIKIFIHLINYVNMFLLFNSTGRVSNAAVFYEV